MLQKTAATSTADTPTAVVQAAATPTVAAHTASKEARRPGKKRRKAWYRQQDPTRGATQAETSHLSGASQAYSTPAPTLPPENEGCYSCGQPGHCRKDCSYRG